MLKKYSCNINLFIYFIFLIILGNKTLFALSMIDSALKVQIDPQIMKADGGSLTEKTLPIFLKKTYEQGIFTKKFSDFPKLNCLEVQELHQKGSQTLKLFAIKVGKFCKIYNKHARKDYEVNFILKESRRGVAEIKNLQIVKNSKLNIADKNQIKREKLPTLSMYNSNFYYTDHKGKSHFFTLLDVAKGDEVKTLHNNFANTYQNKKINNQTQNTCSKDYLTQAFYHVGRSLGAMHNKFMDFPHQVGAVFGPTYVHGDLHMENIFFDGSEVTFIDNETFVNSLKQKQSILIDILRFIGYTIAQHSPRYRHSPKIPPEVWCNVAIDPFFKGYVAGYPIQKKSQMIPKLKDMLMTLKPQNFVKEIDVELWNSAKKKYIAPVLDNLI